MVAIAQLAVATPKAVLSAGFCACDSSVFTQSMRTSISPVIGMAKCTVSPSTARTKRALTGARNPLAGSCAVVIRAGAGQPLSSTTSGAFVSRGGTASAIASARASSATDASSVTPGVLLMASHAETKKRSDKAKRRCMGASGRPLVGEYAQTAREHKRPSREDPLLTGNVALQAARLGATVIEGVHRRCEKTRRSSRLVRPRPPTGRA